MKLQDIHDLERYEVEGKKGVYFLFNGPSLVYIGQSTNIEGRVVSHRKDKVFDSYSYILIADDQERIEEEKLLIMKHNPIYNKTVSKKKKIRLRAFCHFYGVDFDTILNQLSDAGIEPAHTSKLGDPMADVYFLHDLSPFVRDTKERIKRERKATFKEKMREYNEHLKEMDQGRGILIHNADATRLIKGEEYSKALYASIIRATELYQMGQDVDEVVEELQSQAVDGETLKRILLKEKGYLHNKRVLYKALKEEVHSKQMKSG